MISIVRTPFDARRVKRDENEGSSLKVFEKAFLEKNSKKSKKEVDERKTKKLT